MLLERFPCEHWRSTSFALIRHRLEKMKITIKQHGQNGLQMLLVSLLEDLNVSFREFQLFSIAFNDDLCNALNLDRSRSQSVATTNEYHRNYAIKFRTKVSEDLE